MESQVGLFLHLSELLMNSALLLLERAQKNIMNMRSLSLCQSYKEK